MKCIKCGHKLDGDAPRKMLAEIRGVKVEVTVTAPACANCGRVALLGKNVRAYNRAVSDAFRQQAGLLTTVELDRLRRDLRMTWNEFAEYVFVGIATLKRWMRGEIQTQALDRLVRLRADLSFLERTAGELANRLAGSEVSVTVRRTAKRRVSWENNETEGKGSNAA